MQGSLQTYRIRSKKADKYITIKNNSHQKKCVLYEKVSNNVQTLHFNIKDDYFVQFVNPETKEVLTLSEGSDQNGAPFLCQTPNPQNQKSQKFQIHYIEKEANQVAIFTYCGKCLDCCEESTKNDTQIIQWDFHGSDNQKWILQKC